MLAWVGNTTFAAQSLARDLSLGSDGALHQAFVPELRTLRIGDGKAAKNATPGMQVEINASWSVAAGDRGRAERCRFGVHVLAAGSEATYIGVDIATVTVFVDGTRQGNEWIRAAPLLGSNTRVSMHAYVDHAYVTVIFNQQVALTTVVEPSSVAQGGVSLWQSEGCAVGRVNADTFEAFPLKDANNLDVKPL